MDTKQSLGAKFSQYMKTTKKSAHVFRIALIVIALLGIIATFVIHAILTDIFDHYEASRPKYLAEEYFNEIFNDDDYELLYKAAGFDENSYLSKDEFNRWFKDLTDGKEINYKETSAGLSGNSKYIIYLDNKKLGEFLLIPTGIKTKWNFDILVKDEITLELPTDNAYVIRVRQGSTLTVNGVQLDDKYITENGNLISGAYTIYTLNCLIDEPEISVKYQGEECYMIKPEGTDRIYTDEILNDPVSMGGTVTTIRAIKGHSVYIDGKLLDNNIIIENAGGKFDGYFKGKDALEYVVYSYPNEAKNVVIKDENGNERKVEKISGGNIYTDTAIGLSGTIEFMALSDSKPSLDGLVIDEKYIIEKDIKTDSCKYMYGEVKGITYNKYKITWMGDTPTLTVENKYKRTAILTEVEGMLTETIEYDSEALAKHSQLITDASHTYVKMMANDANERVCLSYFDPSSEIYQLVKSNPQGYFTDHESYEFIDSTVKDLYVYDENTFSGSISFVFTVTRLGNVTKYPFNYTLYFRLVDGEYLIYQMINNG